ncbi:alpha/beta fold hydrolase [Halobacteriovorax sp.]|uniref:alpha/beta fold hydrolase n=1 Tax=Halobacteriovorax sp. TaxID=2020862 RepID=UPI00356B45D0
MKKIELPSNFIQLFNSDENFIMNSKVTFNEFLNKAKARSNFYKDDKRKCISLSVENTLENLIEILSLWLLNKSVILHSPDTPEDTVEEYEREINNTYLDSSFNISCFIFTSGSTAKPKAIALTFENIFTAAKNYNEHFNIKPTSYLPITLPIYHVGGLLIFIRALLAGAQTSIHTPGKLTAREFKEAPTHLSVVPLQLERILDKKDDLEFFRNTVFVIGGAKTSLRTLERIEENNISASSTYGMTETSAMIMATEVSSKVDILKSVGRPLNGVNISLSDKQTIIINSPTISPVYPDQVITTNDRAHQKDGLYFIEGRIDDVFISAGENINPLEIENNFIEEGLEDAYIIPVDDETYGQKSFLFYRGNASEKEVKSIAKKKLSPFKRPKHYFKVPDFAFSGIKIKKATLKELAPVYANIDDASSVFPLNYQGDPRRPWIIFLHGFMGDKDDWSEIINILKDEFFCLCIDTPGHGENKKVDYQTLNEYQEEFKHFTNLLNHKFSLVGYSQGGRIAQGLILNGLNVEGLILESTSPGIVDEEERERRYKTDLKMFKNVTNQDELKKFLIYWYQNPLFGELKNHPHFNGLLQRKISIDWKLWQKSMNVFSVGNQPDYREGLSRLKGLKGLTICGENDHKYIASSMEYKTKYKFEFSKISKAAHNTHFENPQEFADIVSKFLKS